MDIPHLQHLFRPIASGWDPIPKEYAASYAFAEWQQAVEIDRTIDVIEAWCGALAGKKVLDLGGGAGQFSIAMARRGADVTWHDPSRHYQAIAAEHAAESGVTLTYSLGYLEEASRLGAESFDLVFNRICWYYCKNDDDFARIIWRLLRPGGSAYLRLHNLNLPRHRTLKYRIACLCNQWLWLKLAYTHPPPGRVPMLLASLPLHRLQVTVDERHSETILFTKAAGQL